MFRSQGEGRVYVEGALGPPSWPFGPDLQTWGYSFSNCRGAPVLAPAPGQGAEDALMHGHMGDRVGHSQLSLN